jgi:hypothetical protein
MKNDRLIHDVSFIAEMHLAEKLNLNEEEKQVVYFIVRAALEAYEVQMNRLQQRLNPVKN